MREYLVKCSNLSATYTAGRFCANSPEEAKEMARDKYRTSIIGREMKDCAAFTFFIAQFPQDNEQ